MQVYVWKCVNTLVFPYSSNRWLSVFQKRWPSCSLTASVSAEGGCVRAVGSPLAAFSARRVFLDHYCVGVDQTFISEKSSSNFDMVSLLYLAQGFPGGVVPARRSNLLMSDRDERNEIVGAGT